MAWNNSSESTVSPTTRLPLPPDMQPGTPQFHALHITGLVSCTISTMFSVSVLVMLMTTGEKMSHFWRRTIGERLVLYLTLCDVVFSANNGTGHVYMLSTGRHPPVGNCVLMAFILETFQNTQSLIVNMAAIVAVVMLVKEKKVGFGKYDLYLLAYAVGVPVAASIGLVCADLLGPSGPWCLWNMKKTGIHAAILTQSALFVTIFFINAVCYCLAVIKLKRVACEIAQLSDTSVVSSRVRTNRSTRVMLLFVVIYLLQWWPIWLYSIWGFIEHPPLWLLLAIVSLCNAGGVFNTFAYTIIRRRNTTGARRSLSLSSYSARTTLSRSLSSYSGRTTLSRSRSRTDDTTIPGTPTPGTPSTYPFILKFPS